MKASGAVRYGLSSGAVALTAGAVLLFFALSREETVIGWSLLGWMVMSVTGVIGGSWMAAVHGRTGSALLAVLVGSMLARLAASGAGAWAASTVGYQAAWPYVIGLGAGYIPLQMFEARWFLTRHGAGEQRAASWFEGNR